MSLVLKTTRKLLKFLVGILILISTLFYFNKEIRTLWVSIQMKIEGVDKMHLSQTKNQWRIFDFSKIQGETKYVGSIDNIPDPALEKYRIFKIKIYKNTGFILANDEEQLMAYGERKYQNDATAYNTYMHNIEKKYTAYIFRSDDHGKSFEKIILGQGTPTNIKKQGDSLLLTVEHGSSPNTMSTSLYLSRDIGKSWHEILHTPPGTTVQLIGMIDSKHYIIRVEDSEGHYLASMDDAGNNLKKLPEVFQKYTTDTNYILLSSKKMYYVINEKKLLSIDLKTAEKEEIHLEIPKDKFIYSIDRDKENSQIYLVLKGKSDEGRWDSSKNSIYYINTNKSIPIPSFNQNEYLYIAGNTIGKFSRVQGILTHIFTHDGINWKYELLPDYLLGPNANCVGAGYGQIWMVIDAIYNPKLVPKKGVYLTIGEIKS